MGHKIRAQLGKTNILGDANNVTQIGPGNQNNSNNTTHNHYHNSVSSTQSDNGEMIFAFLFIVIIAPISYYLFKYGDYILNGIIWLHVFLLLNFKSAYDLYKNRDFDGKDFLNLIFILAIGIISFLYSKGLFSVKEFNALIKHAENKNFSEYWNMTRDWKVYSIYFLISSLLSLVILIINLIYTYTFFRYSKASKKQSSLVGIFIILFITGAIYYFVIKEPIHIIHFINDIKLISVVDIIVANFL